MPDWSRRRALQAAAAAGTFALAGCSGESSSSTEIPPDRGDPVPASDLEVTFVRDADGGRLFEVDDGSDDTDSDRRDVRAEYLTDAADRDRVRFGPGSAAADLRAFVEGTDLESRSVLLLEQPVGACYEARLVGVYRETDGVEADLCRALRPADVECAADDRDTVGVAIRLPFAGDAFGGLGWSWGGDCDRRSIVAREGGGGA